MHRLIGTNKLPVMYGYPMPARDGRLVYEVDAARLSEWQRWRLYAHTAKKNGLPYSDAIRLPLSIDAKYVRGG